MKKLTDIIDVHADDYGLSLNSDTDIITLCKAGKLNSISIIPNMKDFSSSLELYNKNLENFSNPVKISVHLNIMEGKACSSDFSKIPHLVNNKGYFNISWGKLFLYNYIPFFRNTIKKELKHEIFAQINVCLANNLFKNNPIRIDSHQHPHMIPVFYEALFDSIDENKLKIEYIRNTNDPVGFYKNNKTDSFSNILKCIILNHYSKGLSRILKKRNLPDSYLCGVFFSGKMDERIHKSLNNFIHNSEKKGRVCELLFHPGFMLESELTDDFQKKGFNEFHLSENRKIEFNTVSKL